jgi:acyltransferase
MTTNPSNATPPERIAWLDVAKALGIALVFYGHFVERFIPDVPAAMLQMKWVYSFHMPLFFFLSGLVYKERQMAFDVFIRRQIRSRLVPVWVFTLAGVPLWILSHPPGPSQTWLDVTGRCLIDTLRETIQGRPTRNILMWFLVTLFVVELWQFGLRRLTRRLVGLLSSLLLFVVLSLVVMRHSDILHDLWGDRVDWWHLTSAVVAMVFYQTGILAQRLRPLAQRAGAAWYLTIGGFCAAVTVITFNRNFPAGNIVKLVVAVYGDPGWFFLTSFAGTLMVICAARLLEPVQALRRIGTVTLGLMCLNGIMHEYLNPSVARIIVRCWPEPHVALFTLLCLVGTLVSLLLCLPVVGLLDRYVPEVFGRPRARLPAAPAPPYTGSN